MCSEFPKDSENRKFCKEVESSLKKTQSNLSKFSTKFFYDVIRKPPFRVLKLESDNPEHIKRLSQLVEIDKLLEEYNACSKLRSDVKKEIEKLKEKGLSMVVQEDGSYSFINKLDSHYSAKAYILTKLFSEKKLEFVKETDEDGNLKFNLGSLISFFKAPGNDAFVAKYIAELFRNEREFDERLTQGMLKTAEEGTKIENSVKTHLRNKGYEVFDFSADFGYVDYLGIDGVVIINGEAKPYQISKSSKSKKIFNYGDTDCEVLHYTVEGKRIMVKRMD